MPNPNDVLVPPAGTKNPYEYCMDLGETYLPDFEVCTKTEKKPVAKPEVKKAEPKTVEDLLDFEPKPTNNPIYNDCMVAEGFDGLTTCEALK